MEARWYFALRPADQDDERRALQAGAKMEDVTINYQVSCGLDGCVQENYKLSNMARNAKQIQGILGAMDQHARNIGLGSNNVSRGLAWPPWPLAGDRRSAITT